MEALSEDVKGALKSLVAQAVSYKDFYNYYAGDHPVRYATEAMREMFRSYKIKFTQNWCGVVINAANDRLGFKGWDSEIEADNEKLDKLYRAQKIYLLSKKVHLDALLSGSGYLVFDMVEGEPKVYYNSPGEVYVKYSDSDEAVAEFGLKRWDDDSGEYLNVYYPDVIEKFARVKGKGKQFVSSGESANPFGRVPIVHFRSNHSELYDVIPIQDAINMTFSNMMVNSEFLTFPQRYLLTNADVKDLVTSPRSVLKIPKGVDGEESTKIGEFTASGLEGFLDTIERLSNSIAIISRTPRHLFVSVGANVAAETLRIMEAPLVKKVTDYQYIFDEPWRLAAGYFVGDIDGVINTWEPASYQDSSYDATVALKWRTVGLPLVTILQGLGWSEGKIQSMLGEARLQKLAEADMAEEALRLAELRFAASNRPGID